MGRRAWTPLLLLAVLAGAFVAAPGTSAEVRQSGNLRIHFDGGLSPRALPRDRPAPVTVAVEGRVESTDGSHPPPLRSLRIGLNRSGRISTAGLPTCRSAQLQSTTSSVALARCRGALVGRGRFGADLESGEIAAVPARGTILAFNARRGRQPALLLHLYGTVPVQASFVLPLSLERPRSGRFGTVLKARIPVLAGGVGSVTRISLRIGRQYSYRGQRRSYVSASCAAPDGFGVAVFPFASAQFDFVGGQRLGATLTRDCRVR